MCEEDQELTVRLKSNDGMLFDVPIDVAKVSKILKVSSTALKLVIDWSKYHLKDYDIEMKIKDHKHTDDICPWDRELLRVEDSVLFELVSAANYLAIEGLLDVACKVVASKLKDKTPEEIRNKFHIPNDLSKTEEEILLAVNKWSS